MNVDSADSHGLRKSFGMVYLKDVGAIFCAWSCEASPYGPQHVHLQDFFPMQLQVFTSCIPSTLFAVLHDDYPLVNTICCLSTWKNMHVAGDEKLPICISYPGQRAEVLTMSVASIADVYLTRWQQAELQDSPDKPAGIFSEGRTGLGRMYPETNVQHVLNIYRMC